MIFENTLSVEVSKAIKMLYNSDVDPKQLVLQKTKDDFEGDITLVVFALTKISKKSPEETGKSIGEELKKNCPAVKDYNVVKGFLNLVLKDENWLQSFQSALEAEAFGIKKQTVNSTDKPVLVEYSSPNTNKPLHLGHIRNILLGWSVAEILKANGTKVEKVNIVNDRGIHICKSMIAWKKFGNGETPQSTGMKGDHLVGKYYVEYDKRYKQEVETAEKIVENLLIILKNIDKSPQWDDKKKLTILIYFYHLKLRVLKDQNKINDVPDISTIGNPFSEWIKIIDVDDETRSEIIEYHNTIVDAFKNQDFKFSDEHQLKIELIELAKKLSPIVVQTQEILRKWEDGNKEVLELWKMMNGWVYEGFDETYKLLGVDFNKIYYESETYLLGKKIIEEGLQKNIFFKKPDGSIWIDLTGDGLDQKLVLRADGTSVYITQDIGTAQLRYTEFKFGKLIFVVGNEQDYHFKVLKLVLKKLGYDWADNLFHLSYAMVDLPSGKMKSREGTVVDADELMKQMIDEAQKITMELGKIEDFNAPESHLLYKTIGLGALKYFILKVDPEKRMLFNPAESIDFNGNTGPFIQYTYARIQSVIRKAAATDVLKDFSVADVSNFNRMNGKEKGLLKLVLNFPFIIEEAAARFSPAIIANNVFEISKTYNQFYHEFPIVDNEDPEYSKFRLQISSLTAQVIKTSMRLLGIEVPEKM